eukprot:TRINITY_DN39524_c0_g1_i1.p1 TRINITY_DN39524_c0_g1~~TRINITY_DN39524_c0_g1_i1.p1  ORF type:complete len:197 (+),score=20.82 TRINITY_DN39524_c0_g1_i1:37-591(+)
MASDGALPGRAQVSGIFLKTKKCRFYGMGTCTRGSACTFAHTAQELRPRLNLARTKVCPMLLRTGRCTTAECTFAHDREEVQRRRRDCFRDFESRSSNMLQELPEETTPQPGLDGRVVNVNSSGHPDDRCLNDLATEYGLAVIVRNTFIHVECTDLSTSAGITRASSAPGSISDEVIPIEVHQI